MTIFARPHRFQPRRPSPCHQHVKRGHKRRASSNIGDGRNTKEDFETCCDRQVADDFAALVTLSGENRPHGYPKGCHGIEDPNYDPTRP
ncbi:hypothetical protein [Nonomuraea jabiensis]|uniref:hypothetical protein n=1 Tax=Nonomuraea jabiensis TaxID=882448 RepID=UPI003D71A132